MPSATLIQYNSLTPMPAPPTPRQPSQPTPVQLQTAKDEYTAAENGDGQPLPPPFTYGRVYRWLNDENAVPKIPKAPSLSQTELKQLMKDGFDYKKHKEKNNEIDKKNIMNDAKRDGMPKGKN